MVSALMCARLSEASFFFLNFSGKFKFRVFILGFKTDRQTLLSEKTTIRRVYIIIG